MPRTKKQPVPVAVSSPADNGGPALGEVLTLPEAAAYLRLSEADVLRCVHEQGLPARQLGPEWRFSRTAILDWLGAGKSSLQANKEAWLAMAGAWKDDPYVEEELKEIYRRRGRPMTEDES